MPAINSWLADARQQLKQAQISSYHLDAELILAQALEVKRGWLHAHSDSPIQRKPLDKANQLLKRRLTREPIAYITGQKEFYRRDFLVTPDTLIPRPDSEALIELLLKYRQPNHKTLIDVGCGSGCLGITAKLELPDLATTLTDISPAALEVASQNAKNLGADVKLQTSDLLNSVTAPHDIILANLPYVDQVWQRSPETNFEPDLALFATSGGTALIAKLITDTKQHLSPAGLLILEADPRMHGQIKQLATDSQLNHLQTLGYGLIFIKL